jgi:hypothetical protein
MSSKRAAPQSRSKAKSGGGIQSNKRREVGYRGGKRTLDAVSVQAVSELGARTAYKKSPLVKSTPNDFVPLGNSLAAACPQGPGGGRTVYASGYQDQHGAAAKGEGGIRWSETNPWPTTQSHLAIPPRAIPSWSTVK